MKKKLRDLIIYLISPSGAAYFYRAYVRRSGPLVRVLCFHDVADGIWFDSVIKMLKEEFNLITPAEFKAKEFSEDKINILLTFDDGYQSWIDNCLPVLNRYQAKGIFFINSGLLDIAEDTEQVRSYMTKRLLITPKSALTWNGAKTLVENEQTIGGHTVSHPNLAVLDLDVAKEEIVNDKSKIELHLGIKIEDFAYPFGTKKHLTKDSVDSVKNVYSYQYSAISGFTRLDKSILINRTLLENNQPGSQVSNWINGGYDIVCRIKNV